MSQLPTEVISDGRLPNRWLEDCCENIRVCLKQIAYTSHCDVINNTIRLYSAIFQNTFGRVSKDQQPEAVEYFVHEGLFWPIMLNWYKFPYQENVMKYFEAHSEPPEEPAMELPPLSPMWTRALERCFGRSSSFLLVILRYLMMGYLVSLDVSILVSTL